MNVNISVSDDDDDELKIVKRKEKFLATSRPCREKVVTKSDYCVLISRTSYEALGKSLRMTTKLCKRNWTWSFQLGMTL